MVGIIRDKCLQMTHSTMPVSLAIEQSGSNQKAFAGLYIDIPHGADDPGVVSDRHHSEADELRVKLGTELWLLNGRIPWQLAHTDAVIEFAGKCDVKPAELSMCALKIRTDQHLSIEGRSCRLSAHRGRDAYTEPGPFFNVLGNRYPFICGLPLETWRTRHTIWMIIPSSRVSEFVIAFESAIGNAVVPMPSELPHAYVCAVVPGQNKSHLRMLTRLQTANTMIRVWPSASRRAMMSITMLWPFLRQHHNRARGHISWVEPSNVLSTAAMINLLRWRRLNKT